MGKNFVPPVFLTFFNLFIFYEHLHHANAVKVTLFLLLLTLFFKYLFPLPIRPVFVAWNDTTGQVKLAITEPVIHTAPPQCLFTASLQKGHFHIPPSVFILTVAGKEREREYWAEYSLYHRGLSHFMELNLHSHAPQSYINIKWLITVLHGYQASFVINGSGGVVSERKAPMLICCQDLHINQTEQNAASWDVVLITVNLYLSRAGDAHTALKQWHKHTHTDTSAVFHNLRASQDKGIIWISPPLLLRIAVQSHV